MEQKAVLVDAIREYEGKAGLRISNVDDLCFQTVEQLDQRFDHVLQQYGKAV